jgi:ferredoxin
LAAIVFQPENHRVECQVGESIWEVAWREGRPLSSACGAKATCGLCRVKVIAGGEHLGPIGEPDKKHLGNVYFITKVRLGCQARVVSEGEVVVEPVESGKKPAKK